MGEPTTDAPPQAADGAGTQSACPSRAVYEETKSIAVDILRQRYAAGDGRVDYVLGWRYLIGSGVYEDDLQARILLAKVAAACSLDADKGDAYAQYVLGLLYSRGGGVEKNDYLAIVWFRKAADQGLSEGEIALGNSYEFGQGVSRDYDQARTWFQKAASTEAITRLDATIAAARQQTVLQAIQLLSQANTNDIPANYSAIKGLPAGVSISSMSFGQTKTSLQVDNTGCSISNTYPNGTVNTWSLRGAIKLEVLPVERTSAAFTTVSVANGKKVDFVMTAPSQPTLAINVLQADGKWIGGWYFTDDALGHQAANAIRSAVAACGGTIQDWNDPDLQARIDKALQKAGKPHNHMDWGAVMGGVVAGMATFNDGMAANGNTSIQDAANQNVAAIQAKQAQAAAAQAQAAQAREAEAQAAAAQQAAQQQAAQQQAAEQAAAQQEAAQQAAQQAAAQQAALPPGTGCTQLNPEEVTFSSKSLQGQSSCQGEVVGFLTNNTAIAVDCAWAFHKNGGYNGGDNGSGTVQPGQTTGGEQGGLWTCGADDAQMKYACFAHDSKDVHGNACVYTVKF
jgi:hypothetical protein